MATCFFDKNFNLRFSILANPPKLQRTKRGKCGALTRQKTPCQAPPVWDKEIDTAVNGRCKLHGGLSTGPKTSMGKDAIRQSNRARILVVLKSPKNVCFPLRKSKPYGCF